ncbi:LEA type 2 family protein [Haloarchaeobius sp. HME9146]|uniref:LEA type 2 family protein n=1 Tax=Haloarchaeobius sp. HME9146 TaxID=2978732 RepID=UPI0021C103D8|nr:LEA type 2 family protein [Haloarchaeobius sp. HME9146]MCT9096472.1 LEA type 2 family protein [Haloarchaeobius sp. HME9146]
MEDGGAVIDESSSDGGGTVTGLLFGSKLRIAGSVLLSLVVLVGVLVAVVGVGVPSVTGVDNEFGGVNESTTVIVSDLGVNNPNPVGSSFLDVSADYEISMNGISMATGSKQNIETPPGNSSLELRTKLDNEKIPSWWASHIRNGEQTQVDIAASLDSGLVGRSFPVSQQQSIQTDMLSSFNSTETREINANRPLVSDPVLYVNETAGQWGNVTNETTPIVLGFYIYNPKSYPIPVSEIDYDIYMNNITVGNGTNTQEYVLQPGEVTKVRTVTHIQNDRLDEWWVSHIENDQVTKLRIEFDATFEVSGSEITVPLDKFTHRETIETDLFGNKEGSTTGNESTDDGGSGDGSGTSDGTATTTDDGDDTTTSDGTTTTTDGTTTTTTSDGGSGTTTDDDSGTTTTDDGGILAIGVTGDSLNANAVSRMHT